MRAGSGIDGLSRRLRLLLRHYVSNFPKWWFKVVKANHDWQIPFGFRHPALAAGFRGQFFATEFCKLKIRRPADLSYRPFSLRHPATSRLFGVVVLFALATFAIPAAFAANNGTRRHSRLRAIGHAFMNVTLPGVGFLPDYGDPLPADGIKYEIKLAHGQAGDMIDVVYRVGDAYIPEALDQLDVFLRDTHNKDVNQFDPHTFDVLHTMLAKLGKSDGVIDVLSGYRSQETNDELRASGTTNAAEHSQHIVAKAVDLRVEGVPAPLLRDAALSLNAGGVGYYPRSQFVHVDTGPVRKWTYTPHAGRRAGHGSGHGSGRHGRRAHRK